MALGSENKTATLYLGAKSGWHSLLPRKSDQGSIQVPERTLDSVLAENGVTSVDLIKIDVEGAETEVLKGMRDTLTANPNVLILLEIHPQFGVDPAAVQALLTDLGCSAYSLAAPHVAYDSLASNLKHVLVARSGMQPRR